MSELKTIITRTLRRSPSPITPDDVSPQVDAEKVGRNTLIMIDGGPYARINGASVCLGTLLEPENENWHEIGDETPDGAFAIIRSNDQTVQLVTDTLGQRTLWYVLTENFFIDSTSQRAILLYLGGFELNEAVIPWMLATGTLGPLQSCDKRINMVPANSIATLNQQSWDISIATEPLPYAIGEETDEQLSQRYKTILADNFKRLDLDCDTAAITLSGGYDSRAILMTLRNRKGLRSISVAPDSNSPLSIRSIVSKLADHFDVPSIGQINGLLRVGFVTDPAN